MYDSPVQHPRISDKEKKYILDAIGDKVQQHGTKVRKFGLLHIEFKFKFELENRTLVTELC